MVHRHVSVAHLLSRLTQGWRTVSQLSHYGKQLPFNLFFIRLKAGPKAGGVRRPAFILVNQKFVCYVVVVVVFFYSQTKFEKIYTCHRLFWFKTCWSEIKAFCKQSGLEIQ